MSYVSGNPNAAGFVDKVIVTGDSSTPQKEEEGIELTDALLREMQVVKHFRLNTDPINSFDFSKNGMKLVSAADDDQIIVYDCEKGKDSRTLKSKKYGVSQIRCTHAENAVIHASSKVDDTIRYLSLHDNKYLRYFHGHQGAVTGIRMSPIDDVFLSTSMDKSLRLWDLRSPSCHGFMQLQTVPTASMDPEGLIFAVVLNNTSIKLYDLRTFDRGPFTHFQLPEYGRPGVVPEAALKFSPDGKLLTLNRLGISTIHVIDAFDGKPLHNLEGHNVGSKVVFEPEFTPDSKFIVSGSEDGRIHFWNAVTGMPVGILNGGHPRPTRFVKFNPSFLMMASACTDMAFWLPRTF